MRRKIVAGNWKMNKNLGEGIALAQAVNEFVSQYDNSNVKVILGTPFIHLTEVTKCITTKNIEISAQNCAAEKSGAYTGEVSAEMIKSTGATFVILGHSERRAYYGETDAILVKKVEQAFAAGMQVIFCVGEVLAQREAGNHFEVVKSQLENGLFNLSAEAFAHVVLAYEPVWAIGTGKTATPEQAQEMHAFIRGVVAAKYGQAVADDTTILYGGSCNAANAAVLFANPDVDGGLIGGASLKPADFAEIIKARS